MKTIEQLFLDACAMAMPGKKNTVRSIAKVAAGLAVIGVITEVFSYLIEGGDEESDAMELLEPEENIEVKASAAMRGKRSK